MNLPTCSQSFHIIAVFTVSVFIIACEPAESKKNGNAGEESTHSENIGDKEEEGIKETERVDEEATEALKRHKEETEKEKELKNHDKGTGSEGTPHSYSLSKKH